VDQATDINALTLEGLYAELCARGRGASLTRRILTLALDEDIGAGDATASALPAPDRPVIATLRAREAMVVAGLRALPVLIEVFHEAARPDLQAIRFEASMDDGSQARAGQPLGTIAGPLEGVLTIERTMLNLLGRLSGVATTTARFVERAREGGKSGVYDTRKTTPGLRRLEKYAVRCGGGLCHRLDLADALLIKDNHLAGVGDAALAGVATRMASEARRRAVACGAPLRFVMVEVDRLEQLEALLTLPNGVVDLALLDNMTPEALAEAVRRRDKAGASIELEASGGITLATIAQVASSGVDRISVGSLTRAAVVVDIGLDIDDGAGSAA